MIYSRFNSYLNMIKRVVSHLCRSIASLFGRQNQSVTISDFLQKNVKRMFVGFCKSVTSLSYVRTKCHLGIYC